MTDLKQRCEEWLAKEGFFETRTPYETTVSTKDSMVSITTALEAFALAVRREALIEGMDKVRDEVEAWPGVYCEFDSNADKLIAWIDQQIAQLDQAKGGDDGKET